MMLLTILVSLSSLVHYQAFVIQGSDRIGARFNSHYVIKKLKVTVKSDGNVGRTVYYNQFNDSDLRKNNLYSQAFTIGWTSNFKSAFNFYFVVYTNSGLLGLKMISFEAKKR